MMGMVFELGPRGWGGLLKCRNGRNHMKEKELLKISLEVEKGPGP